ncbi:hypothetical protein GUITHDRAFT_60846, partial [Guillardia theta CCMP2712]
ASRTFVVNGQFPHLCEEFLAPAAAVKFFRVCWARRQLSWREFDTQVIGGGAEDKLEKGSIREIFLRDWKELGLPAAPAADLELVFASSSSWEFLRDRRLWLGEDLAGDEDRRLLV